MRLRDIGEMGLIKLLSKDTLISPAGVRVGIGDDTAVLEMGKDRLLLATVDMLLEGEHFLPVTIPPKALGHKALAVNLSDIAAMGGVARHALVAIGIPSDREVEEIEDIYAGMKELACQYGVNIVGGDTVRSPQGLVLSITVLGEVEEENLTLRRAARAGDKILVTGDLGKSQAGLTLLLAPKPLPLSDAVLKQAKEAHYYPQPRLREIRALLSTGAVRAVNDVSDGLAKDLREIAESSGIGAELWPEELPISSATRAVAAAAGQDPLAYALYGGEDFELLFTADPERVDAVLACGQREGIPLRVIGEVKPVAAGLTLRWQDGRVEPLRPGGWEHFQRQGEDR
ncbi:MAG TPA: thiamine-phosphate kinase [Firmicutes bacterium]|nr:thiamine-phosphate kinase [Bacillota bacterium]